MTDRDPTDSCGRARRVELGRLRISDPVLTSRGAGLDALSSIDAQGPRVPAGQARLSPSPSIRVWSILSRFMGLGCVLVKLAWFFGLGVISMDLGCVGGSLVV